MLQTQTRTLSERQTVTLPQTHTYTHELAASPDTTQLDECGDNISSSRLYFLHQVLYGFSDINFQSSTHIRCGKHRTRTSARIQIAQNDKRRTNPLRCRCAGFILSRKETFAIEIKINRKTSRQAYHRITTRSRVPTSHQKTTCETATFLVRALQPPRMLAMQYKR